MVRDIMMTDEQIAELVDLARKDPVLWQQLKERELEIERILAAAAAQGKWFDDDDLIIDPPPLEPSMPQLVDQLFKRRYGLDEISNTGPRSSRFGGRCGSSLAYPSNKEDRQWLIPKQPTTPASRGAMPQRQACRRCRGTHHPRKGRAT